MSETLMCVSCSTMRRWIAASHLHPPFSLTSHLSSLQLAHWSSILSISSPKICSSPLPAPPTDALAASGAPDGPSPGRNASDRSPEDRKHRLAGDRPRLGALGVSVVNASVEIGRGAAMTTDVGSAQTATDDEYVKEWRAFAKSLEIPPMVKKIMKEVKGLELELGEKLVFGGPRGSLKGRAKVEEEQRHGSFYKHLPDLEQKLQFFTARQVACRILGSKGYLCEHVPIIGSGARDSQFCVGFLSRTVSALI